MQSPTSPTSPTVEWKVCYACKENKSVTEYYRNTYSSDGLYFFCKSCYSKGLAIDQQDQLLPTEECSAVANRCRLINFPFLPLMVVLV